MTELPQSLSAQEKQTLNHICQKMTEELISQRDIMCNYGVIIQVDYALSYKRSKRVLDGLLYLATGLIGKDAGINLEKSTLDPDSFLSSLYTLDAVTPETIIDLAQAIKEYFETPVMKAMTDINGNCFSLFGVHNRKAILSVCDNYIQRSVGSIVAPSLKP